MIDNNEKLKSLIKNDGRKLLFKNETPITLTSLSARAKNALINYGINNIHKMSELPISQLFKIPNIGKGSISEIISFIEHGEEPINIKKVIEDYIANKPIDKILKGYRIRHKDLKQILEISDKEKISEESRHEIREQRESERDKTRKQREFERKKTSFLENENKRNQKIIEQWNSCRHTYESISKKADITRERVRQILLKAENVYHIPIKSTSEASKGRSKAVLEKALENLDIKRFIIMYESGKKQEKIIKKLRIQSSDIYDHIEKKLHHEKEISKLKRTVSKLKKSRKLNALDPGEQQVRKVIIDMRDKGCTIKDIANACNLSQPSISNKIRAMKNEGINVSAPLSNPSWAYEESIRKRGKDFTEDLNEIEVYLEKGYSPRKIARIMGINDHTMLRLIVENF